MWETDMGEPIMWGGDDPFTHLLTVGPTRCGKSATILEPICYQLLLQKKFGKKLGFSLIEPKGDLVRKVKEYCDAMEIPYIFIDPEYPQTHKFNVMEGNKDDVAEATVAVLQSLFGKQEAFFQTVQELSTRNVTKLLKELRGNDVDLLDLLETLRDENLLRQRVTELKRKNPSSDLIPFFDNELLGSLQEQYRKLVIGLRAQLENITSNQKLKRILSGKSDINLDKHLADGGILLVNTALGTLKKAGDAFGTFVIMHLQSATFRREGTERTRTPHFLIADEYSRYINPDVEMFLSIAASYRVAGIFATQSLGQLEVESGKLSGKAMKQAILTSCRNKIAFCGLSAQDAKEFADEFGKDIVIQRQATYKNKLLLPRLFPEHYRDTEIEEYRYHYTYLQDSMKRFHFICRLLKDGTPQRPFEGVGQFVPKDWKERREWDLNNKDKKKVIVFPKILNNSKMNENKLFKKPRKSETEDKEIPKEVPREIPIKAEIETVPKKTPTEIPKVSTVEKTQQQPMELNETENETIELSTLTILEEDPLGISEKEKREIPGEEKTNAPVEPQEIPESKKTKEKVDEKKFNSESTSAYFNSDEFFL